MKIGEEVRVAWRKDEERGKKDAEMWARKKPAGGTVAYAGKRFVVVAFHTEDGRFLYCETMWPEDVIRSRSG